MCLEYSLAETLDKPLLSSCIHAATPQVAFLLECWLNKTFNKIAFKIKIFQYLLLSVDLFKQFRCSNFRSTRSSPQSTLPLLWFSSELSLYSLASTCFDSCGITSTFGSKRRKGRLHDQWSPNFYRICHILGLFHRSNPPRSPLSLSLLNPSLNVWNLMIQCPFV